jgi:hypothetical protein
MKRLFLEIVAVFSILILGNAYLGWSLWGEVVISLLLSLAVVWRIGNIYRIYQRNLIKENSEFILEDKRGMDE